MKLLLQQENLPNKRLRPSLLRPLYRSLRAAEEIVETDRAAETSLLLTDNRRIQDLNRDFRGIDRPTDVLSFSQDDPTLLGDIVISMETAERQAAAADWPESSELALLAVHGFLHLVGYEDRSLQQAQEMEKMTRLILTAAGVQLPHCAHPFFQSLDASER